MANSRTRRQVDTGPRLQSGLRTGPHPGDTTCGTSACRRRGNHFHISSRGNAANDGPRWPWRGVVAADAERRRSQVRSFDSCRSADVRYSCRYPAVSFTRLPKSCCRSVVGSPERIGKIRLIIKVLECFLGKGERFFEKKSRVTKEPGSFRVSTEAGAIVGRYYQCGTLARAAQQTSPLSRACFVT